MINQLIQNLSYVGIAFALFAVCVFANIAISTYYNIDKKGQAWNWKKFGIGMVKMLVIGLSTSLLAIVATLISSMAIQGDVANGINIGIIAALYISAIAKYFSEAVNKIKEILENRDIVSDISNIKK